MSLCNKRIHLLDHETQAKIRSSSQIANLNQIIVELVSNAIDAGASRIKVDLSYTHGFCSVLDNGVGIASQEFRSDGGLAQAYCSSKKVILPQNHHSGTSLASIAGVSLMAIESKTEVDHSANLLWCDASGRLSTTTLLEHGIEGQHGTKVRVYNLFTGLPVRRKFLDNLYLKPREVQADFDRLKILMTATVLASPKGFGLDIRHMSPRLIYCHRHRDSRIPSIISPNMSPSVAKVKTIFCESGLSKTTGSCSWKSCRLTTAQLSVHATICLTPMPHKLLQFIIRNDRSLCKVSHGALFDSINGLFETSSFARTHCSQLDVAQHESEQASKERRTCSPPLAGPDKWPMFVLWMRDNDLESGRDEGHLNEKHLGEEDSHRFFFLLRPLFLEFLAEHRFLSLKTARIESVLSNASQDNLASSSNQHSVQHSREQMSCGRNSSRSKASSIAVIRDIATGLPLHRHSPPATSAGETLALESLRSMVGSSDNRRQQALTPREQPEQCVWTDITIGRTFQMDPRTGMVVAKPPINAGRRGDFSANVPDAEMITPAGDFQKSKLSLALTLRTVERHQQDVKPEHNKVIRSMTLLDELVVPPTLKRHKLWCTTSYAEDDTQATSYSSFLKLGNDILRVSRHDLSTCNVIKQVDKKFILFSCGTKKNLRIVLADQHAVDERRQIEILLRCMYKPVVLILSQPLVFEIAWREARILQSMQTRFERFGIRYDCVRGSKDISCSERSHHTACLKVTQLPKIIAERCRSTPALVIDLLRDELWSAVEIGLSPSTTAGLTDSGDLELHHASYHVPRRLLDLLNSRACRSAIMFNDELETDECTNLINELSACTLPFQCAHGRPSMIVLAELGRMPFYDALQSTTSAVVQRFGRRGDAAQCLKRGHCGSSHGQTWPESYRDRGFGLNTCDRPQTLTFAEKYRAWTSNH